MREGALVKCVIHTAKDSQGLTQNTIISKTWSNDFFFFEECVFVFRPSCHFLSLFFSSNLSLTSGQCKVTRRIGSELGP